MGLITVMVLSRTSCGKSPTKAVLLLLQQRRAQNNRPPRSPTSAGRRHPACAADRHCSSGSRASLRLDFKAMSNFKLY